MKSITDHRHSSVTKKVPSHASLLVSSEKWLSIYGLKKLKLDSLQILSYIGFKNSDEYIDILKKPVSSRYGNGLFKKLPHKNGMFYNLIASKDTLNKIKLQLEETIETYKARLEWLTSSSRKSFGVIEEKSACIVVDIQDDSDEIFQLYIHILLSLIKEQLACISKFNFIRAASEIQHWQEHCVGVNVESVSDAKDWLQEQAKQVEYSSTSVLESVIEASKDEQIEAIYIFTDGSLCKSGKDILMEKIKNGTKSIHVVNVCCKTPYNLPFLTELAKVTGGRFNLYSVCEEDQKILATNNKVTPGRGYGVQPDVMLIWEELDQARTTLSDVENIIRDLDCTKVEAYPEKKLAQFIKPVKISDEMFMSSREWLKKHGLRKSHLNIQSFLQTLVFNHCDGVVDMHCVPTNEGIVPVQPTHIHARYCNKFAHIKWSDGSLKHVYITSNIYETYKQKLLLKLEKYKQRLNWLKKGSRELFGTIIENKVIIIIDTSSSMGSRLCLVKEKLLKLFQEQLVDKEEFSVIHFNSSVEEWRDYLVKCNIQNLDNAWLWVKDLRANGSTNTLGAINAACKINNVQGLYLLSDGRPDQPPETIFSQVDTAIPIHTISFNCADAEANQFLHDLSSKTGGRYHYFSEEIRGCDDGPQPYQSKDLILIKREIEQGLRDLETILSLRNDCIKTESHHEHSTDKNNSSMNPNNQSRSLSISSRRIRPASVSEYTNNRASLLRGNISLSRVKANVAEESKNNVKTTVKKKKKKKRKTVGSEIKRWLSINGLSARKLTITDAMAPTIIEQKPVYVPTLGKEVTSKVYGQVLPIVRTSHGKELHIVNPQAVDLFSYEEDLKQCLQEIEMKLNNFAFENVSEDAKERYCLENGTAPSYIKNKVDMKQEIDGNASAVVIKDIKRLEQELDQGKMYLKQSEELREMVKKLSREGKEKRNKKHIPSPSEKQICKKNAAISEGNSRLRYHRILARSDVDGYYYPALVNKYVNPRFVNVCFDNGENQLTSVRYVISIGGSTACPTLNVGDYVLVKSPVPYSDDIDENYCYIPAIVQVTPLTLQSVSKCYTVIRYNGAKMTVVRKDIIKITRSRFIFSTRFIQEVGLLSLRNSGGIKEQGHLPGNSRRSSSASSHASSYTSKSSVTSSKHNSEGESETLQYVSASKSSADEDQPICKDDVIEHDISKKVHEERNSSSSSSSSDEDIKLTEWKKRFEENHSEKLKELEEQKNILIELQETLRLNEEKQTQQQLLLEKQQQQLYNEQKELIEKQIKQQNEERQQIKEYKNLSEIQLEISKRQQQQQDQLFKHLLDKKELQQEQQHALQEVIRLKDEQTSIDLNDFPPDSVEVRSTPRLGTPDMVDGRSEIIFPNALQEQMNKKRNETPDVKVFVAPNTEAVLMAQGGSGIFVSRNPLDKDPAVEIRNVPSLIKINMEVLARFKEDGWYYRGTIRKTMKDNVYVIEDGVGDMEEINCVDIITDDDDADKIIQIGDYVVALHPRFQYAYAPGLVHSVEKDGALRIQFYDRQMAVVPRGETYLVLPAKYEHDCNYIQQCEDALIGQAVVCRDNNTGVYCLGAVRDRVAGPRSYLIEWSDQTLEIQNYAYIFGAHTKIQKYENGSHILAISDNDSYSYLPGIVIDCGDNLLHVKLCDGSSNRNIDPVQSFWLSPEYYEAAVKYWHEHSSLVT